MISTQMMKALIFGGRITQDHQIKSQEKIYVSRCSSQPDADSLSEADATSCSTVLDDTPIKKEKKNRWHLIV